MTTLTPILDFDHARLLVATGDAEACLAHTAQEAEYLRVAFIERGKALGDSKSCDAIEEGQWLYTQIRELDSEWGCADSPECNSHLY